MTALGVKAEERAPMLAFLRAIGDRIVRTPRFVFALIALAWFAWIAHLSSGPIDLDPPLPFASFFTNLAHAPLFGIGALWVCAAMARRESPFPWPRLVGLSGWLVVLLVGGYGVTDEWHQSTVVGRSSCWLDVVTDTTAAIAVVATVRRVGEAGVSEGRLRLTLGSGLLACCGAALSATLFCS